MEKMVIRLGHAKKFMYPNTAIGLYSQIRSLTRMKKLAISMNFCQTGVT